MQLYVHDSLISCCKGAITVIAMGLIAHERAQGFFGMMILANFVVNIAETMLEEEVLCNPSQPPIISSSPSWPCS